MFDLRKVFVQLDVYKFETPEEGAEFNCTLRILKCVLLMNDSISYYTDIKKFFCQRYKARNKSMALKVVSVIDNICEKTVHQRMNRLFRFILAHSAFRVAETIPVSQRTHDIRDFLAQKSMVNDYFANNGSVNEVSEALIAIFRQGVLLVPKATTKLNQSLEGGSGCEPDVAQLPLKTYIAEPVGASSDLSERKHCIVYIDGVSLGFTAGNDQEDKEDGVEFTMTATPLDLGIFLRDYRILYEVRNKDNTFVAAAEAEMFAHRWVTKNKDKTSAGDDDLFIQDFMMYFYDEKAQVRVF